MANAVTIEPLTIADRDALVALDQSAFAFDTRDLDLDADTAWIEWDRVFGAYRGGTLAGIYVVFSFGLSVPGALEGPAGVVPMAGLSWVAVHPDHRRRGVLRALIEHHLEGVRHGERQEPVSCLFASESAIYGRFGYGLSTHSQRLTLSAKGPLRAPSDPGEVEVRFEAADPGTHDKVIRQVYDAACLLRPGYTVRPPQQWQRFLEDRPARRPAGAEALKILVAQRSGEPTGYALLRRTASWGEHAPEGKVQVNDFQAVDPQTAYALWRRVLDFDLMAEVTTPCLAADDPLTTWAFEANPGVRRGHELWTRIVDLPGALTARGYSHELDVVLEVTDQACPWNAGRWRLCVDSAGSAMCDPTKDVADLVLDARELGSAYLGGITFDGLARAGLVDERSSGALSACSHAFRSAVLPATPYMF